MDINIPRVSSVIETFIVKAQVGRNYESFESHWKTNRRSIRDAFKGMRVRGPYPRGEEVVLSYAKFFLEKDVKPCDIYDSIDSHNLRNCGFWELVWTLCGVSTNQELFSKLSPLIALGSHVSEGYGRFFVCMSGEFFDPALSLVSESDIGLKARSYKFLVLPSEAPELVMELVAA